MQIAFFYCYMATSWFGTTYEQQPRPFKTVRSSHLTGQVVLKPCPAPYRIDHSKTLGIGDTVYCNRFGWGVVLDIMPDIKKCVTF